MSDKCFIHVDLDAFYASVEQLDNPEYKGKPVIVGSLPTDRRGVVSTCSYEARAYGVHSAMPIGTAVKLCPHGIFLRGRMKRYQERSKEVMSIFADFSPDIHQISVDEAFIDITGTERLFGKPIDVAMALKNRVKEETGLTVSVGISSTKYIAKIASGMKKPDGLFIVEDGKEEDFMLNLPLKDIWGIGQKTVNRIKEAGFFTTKDVHKASKTILTSLFGVSTGTFLFDAVRGSVYETFNETPKSRSMSSERTFSFDLTDRYAIETALMELSWDVMYRLFTEKWTSKTAHVKIRYEDFTTVSIQETSTRAISSCDELFTRVKALFDKKYENGRGIRLIGVSTQNLEDSTLPSQQDLFDFEDKKKATVEKTVIEMKKKNPGIQISKARLMKDTLIFICSLFLLIGTSAKSFAQSGEKEPLAIPFEDAFISGEAPIAMFNLTEDSNQVEFFAEGSWESLFTNYINISGNQKNTSGISFSFNPPIFIQKTDLTVWFLLQDMWYFEANVADEFDESTVAAGYHGEGILKHARIGNRNITFQQNYGVTDADRGIGSGSNQAPGLMTEWEGENWEADAILRYDMIESMEKTWIGQNEATENIIHLSDWQLGTRFILPSNSVENIQSIYVESSNPDDTLVKDTEGLTYKKLASSEYLLIPSENLVVLNAPTDNNVLITFHTPLPSLGDLNTQNTFLGDVQEWFGTFSIAEYLPESFSTKINGTDALIVQRKNFFSPFLDSSLYSISSFSSVDTVSIVSNVNNISDKDYGALIVSSSTLEVPGFSSEDIFNEQKKYIQVFNQNSASNEASKRFPFANKYPLVYLTPASSMSIIQENSDTVISAQTLVQSSVLDIGTEAIEGSITVYRNGIKESLYRYDAKTGLINLSSPPGSFDTIRITWKENNDTAANGSLTFAAGYKHTLNPSLSLDFSTSVLMPILETNAFTDSSFDAPATVNVAFGTNFKNESFLAENVLLASVENTDISNSHRIDAMDSFQVQESNLTSTAHAKIPNSFTPIVNGRPGESSPILLDTNLRGELISDTIRDTSTGEYIVQSDWELSNNNSWVAQTIILDGYSYKLPSAESFSIWLKQDSTSIGNDFRVFLQLGVDDNEQELYELPKEIPTWDLISNADVQASFNTNNTNWQKVTVMIDNEDRARLSEYHNARIILVAPSSGSTFHTEGRFQVGSFEVSGNSYSMNGNGLTGIESQIYITGKDELQEMKRFNTGSTNIVQQFQWDDTVSLQDMNATKFVSAIPLDIYNELSFFAYIPEDVSNDAGITLSLKRDSDFGEKTAFSLELKKDALDMLKGSWKQISIHLSKNTVFVDSVELPKNFYTMSHIDTSIAPTKIFIEFTGSGKIYLDELHLNESLWNFKAENILDIAYTKSGILLGTEDLPIFSNAKLEANVRTGLSTPIDNINRATEIGLVTDTNANIDIMGVKTEGSIIFSSSNTQSTLSNQDASFYLESASHRVSTTPAFNIFEIFAFEEHYRFLPLSSGAKKRESFSLDFSPLGFNFNTSFITEAEQEYYSYYQDVENSNSISFDSEFFNYTLNANIYADQSGYSNNYLENTYASSWLDISKLQFSFGYNDATKRNVALSVNQVFDFKKNSFKPAIFIEGKNTYTNSIDTVNETEDAIKISIPFSIGAHDFTTEFNKKIYVDRSRDAGMDYINDTRYYFETMENRVWAYKTIPLYDFFDLNILKDMQNTIEKNSSIISSAYSNELSIEWQRKFFSNPFDIFVPTRASVAILRDIRASSIDSVDLLQVISNVSFFSINNFGKYAENPVFTWYEQDEIIQSFKLTYSLDTLENSNWRLNFAGYNQISLYLGNNQKLTSLTELQLDTERDWNVNVDLLWERNGSSSFVVDGLYVLFPKLLETEKGFTRENSINIGISELYSEDDKKWILSQLYGISHSIDIHINDYADISLDLAAEIFIQESAFLLQNMVSIGAKITF